MAEVPMLMYSRLSAASVIAARRAGSCWARLTFMGRTCMWGLVGTAHAREMMVSWKQQILRRALAGGPARKHSIVGQPSKSLASCAPYQQAASWTCMCVCVAALQQHAAADGQQGAHASQHKVLMLERLLE